MLASTRAGRSALDAPAERTAGSPKIIVGLIDGPVAGARAELATENIRILSQVSNRAPENASGTALRHGTFIAGILAARRGSAAPAICPDCPLVVRPIFLQPPVASIDTPSANAQHLADLLQRGMPRLAAPCSVSTFETKIGGSLHSPCRPLRCTRRLAHSSNLRQNH